MNGGDKNAAEALVAARLKGREVLITGGAGYIGSHAVKAFREVGCRVTVLDNLERGHEEAVTAANGKKEKGKTPLVVLKKADLRDAAQVDAVFKAHRFAGVVHFAGLALVGESVREPEEYYRTNVLGGLNLLSACRRFKVEHFVFSSTCAVYGNPVRLPLDEAHPHAPISPYGKTKAHFEDALTTYYEAYGLNYLAFRYFNAAGADSSGMLGEDHEPETHLIPNVFRVLLGQKDRLTVFGRDYPTPDGTCIRDYIHVSDLARAHLLGLAYLLGGGESGAINLGTGCGYSVLEVIRACEEVAGTEVKVEYGARRPGDPPELTAAAQKAREVLGFVPERSDLKTIVADAWRRHRNHPGGFQTKKGGAKKK